jgi:predicted phosphodiesterase
MRLAVLADIHGNALALEAVLADLRGQSPDLVVNLGDCLSGPLDPVGTAALLMQAGFPTVRGNHDRQLLDRPIGAMNATDAFTAARLGPAHRDWLAALPATLAPVPGVLACHGRPDDDDAYLMERLEGASVVAVDAAELAARLGPTPGADLVLCGHSHLPRLLRASDGRLVVNPGSVGLQAYRDPTPVPHAVEHGAPQACYAVLDRGPAGWSVAFRAIPYDWASAAAQARAAGRPDWAGALLTGRWTPPAA